MLMSLNEAANAFCQMVRIEGKDQSLLHQAVLACARKDAEEFSSRLEMGEGVELAILSLPGLWLAAYCEYVEYGHTGYDDDFNRTWSTVRAYAFELAKTCWPEEYASAEEEVELYFVDSLQMLIHRRLGLPKHLERIDGVCP